MPNETDDFEPMTSVRSTESELKELLGLFDAPAFARRGRDVEWAVRRTTMLCEKRRTELLEMVHCRLRMWANGTSGPEDWRVAFRESIDDLWTLTGADPPVWKAAASPSRKKAASLAIGLVNSVERFNHRWLRFVNDLQTDTVNRQIDRYNKYYVLEKECIVGSSRLASRLFVPQPRIEPDWLLSQFPMLPVPEVR